jgi:hypothetical protein
MGRSTRSRAVASQPTTPFIEDASIRQLVDAVVPRESWDEAYFSFLSLKSHLQSLPSWVDMKVDARERPDGTVEVLVTTGWSSADAIAVWLDHGLTPDALLRALTPPARQISVRLILEVI